MKRHIRHFDSSRALMRVVSSVLLLAFFTFAAADASARTGVQDHEDQFKATGTPDYRGPGIYCLHFKRGSTSCPKSCESPSNSGIAEEIAATIGCTNPNMTTRAPFKVICHCSSRPDSTAAMSVGVVIRNQQDLEAFKKFSQDQKIADRHSGVGDARDKVKDLEKTLGEYKATQKALGGGTGPYTARIAAKERELAAAKADLAAKERKIAADAAAREKALQAEATRLKKRQDEAAAAVKAEQAAVDKLKKDGKASKTEVALAEAKLADAKDKEARIRVATAKNDSDIVESRITAGKLDPDKAVAARQGAQAKVEDAGKALEATQGKDHDEAVARARAGADKEVKAAEAEKAKAEKALARNPNNKRAKAKVEAAEKRLAGAKANQQSAMAIADEREARRIGTSDVTQDSASGTSGGTTARTGDSTQDRTKGHAHRMHEIVPDPDDPNSDPSVIAAGERGERAQRNVDDKQSAFDAATKDVATAKADLKGKKGDELVEAQARLKRAEAKQARAQADLGQARLDARKVSSDPLNEGKISKDDQRRIDKGTKDVAKLEKKAKQAEDAATKAESKVTAKAAPTSEGSGAPVPFDERHGELDHVAKGAPQDHPADVGPGGPPVGANDPSRQAAKPDLSGQSQFKDGGEATTKRLDNGEFDHSVSLAERRDKFSTGSVSSDDEDCSVSGAIDAEKFGCRGTRKIVQGAQITNTMTQTVGSVAVTAMGQSAQQTAMEQGTQSSALRAAASTQDASGKIQLAAGAVNAMLGVMQMQRKFKHDSNRKDIRQAGNSANELNAEAGMSGSGQTGGAGFVTARNPNGTLQKIIDTSDGEGRNMNEASEALIEINRQCPNPNDPYYAGCRERAIKYREAQLTRKKQEIASQSKRLAMRAAGEQSGMSDEAMAGAMMSLTTGTTQMISGGFNIAAANQLKKAARNMARLENMKPVGDFTPTPPGAVVLGDPLAPGGGQSLNTSTANNEGAQVEEEDIGPAAFGDLGDPTGVLAPNDPGLGPEGGGFVAGGGGGAPGGGGGGFGGVGGASTQAANGDSTEPSAKMVDQSRGAGYDGAAGGGFSAGGGGGVGADRGPDLSGMLAQFLPQKQDEERGGNGILDFGGRGLAGEAPISLLDRNANIFDRIHETYQDKNRRGRVGL